MEEIDLNNADLYDLPPINGNRFGMLVCGLGLIALEESSSPGSKDIDYVRLDNSDSKTIANTND